MTKLGTVLYVSVLIVFALLTLLSVWLGLWLYAVLAIVFGVAFFYAGWFVLARAWRPTARHRRRPVRRRR